MNDSIIHIPSDDPRYPATLKTSVLLPPPKRLSALGNLDLLKNDLLGIFCSIRCPGDLILKTYDLAQILRDNGVPTLGGFHTAMEKETLDLLMRGDQPIVICPARSLETMRVPKAWHAPLAEGRLLILSPFEDKHRRVTAKLAEQRNRFAASLADRLLIIHADPAGKTSSLTRDAIAAGKIVYTLESKENAHLIKMGTQAYSPEQFAR